MKKLDYRPKYMMETENSNYGHFEIKEHKKYKVDFDKVNNFDDLKNVVQILFAGLPITINENCGFIEEVREYLKGLE